MRGVNRIIVVAFASANRDEYFGGPHSSLTKSNQLKRLRQKGLLQLRVAGIVGADPKTMRRHLSVDEPKRTRAPTGSEG